MEKAVKEFSQDAELHDQIIRLESSANHFETESQIYMKASPVKEDAMLRIKKNGLSLIKIYEELIQKKIKNLEVR